jgi:FKBP-type peptidyl-prolyl cis-trans isomerase SlpA
MIKENDVVELHYTGKFEDGEVFDSSVGSNPIRVEIGNGSLIRGFEQSLLGKSVGEEFSIEIQAEDAYGEVKEELIVEIPKDKMPGEVEVGQALTANSENGAIAQVVVKEIKEETVVIDGNHPLSGKTLLFDIQILSVN